MECDKLTEYCLCRSETSEACVFYLISDSSANFIKYIIYTAVLCVHVCNMYTQYCILHAVQPFSTLHLLYCARK